MQTGKFHFGMRGHDLGANFDEMIKNALLNDIKILQFAPKKTMQNIDFSAIGYDEGVARHMAESFKEKGIEIAVLGCYINPIAEDEKVLESNLKLFEEFIPYAKAVDATVIGTETGYIPPEENDSYPKAYSLFMSSLERLLPVAERYNVNIGIEPVSSGVVCSVSVMKKIMDYFKSDNLKMIFDPVNILNIENYKNQREIIDEAFELTGENIASFHLKDFKVTDKYAKVPVGEGELDIEYCLKKLGEMKNIPHIILDEMPLCNLQRISEYLSGVIKR